MSVDNTTFKKSAAGNGAATNFPVTEFEILEAADVVVTLINDTTGRRTRQTVTTHYTVTLDNPSDLPSTFDVDMVAAPASGETLEIRRARAKTTSTTFPTGGNFPTDPANQQIDSLAMPHIDDAHYRELRATLLTFADAGGNYTLDLDERDFGGYEIGGSPGATRTLTFPTGVAQGAWVHNQFADSSALTVAAAGGGDTISVAALAVAYVYSDGTDVKAVLNLTSGVT